MELIVFINLMYSDTRFI